MTVVWAVVIGLAGVLLIVYGMMSKNNKKNKDFMFKEIDGGDIFRILEYPMDDMNGVKLTTLPAGRVYELHEYHNITRQG